MQQELRPDITLLLDVPVEIGLARANGRGSPDRFEQETLEFFEGVRAGYLELAANEPSRYRVIDASRSLAEVQAQLSEALKPVIEQQL